MIAATTSIPAPSTLLRLGRISNLPTVWTNVIAGSVIAGGATPNQLALTMTAMTAFYVGGMYLNDFFDRAVDARERPGRPIDAGEIQPGSVCAIGLGLLAAGVMLMVALGLAATLCGALLAGTIVLYDVWHKKNALSPVIMGLCRALVYIGAAVAATGSVSAAIGIGAFALACHVAGLSYAAKQESLNRIGNLWPLLMLAVPVLVALPAAGGWLVAAGLMLLVAADTFAVRLLVRKGVEGAVPLAVSGLIAAICLLDAVAIASVGGGLVVVALCALGYPLTRRLQKFVPGT
jgi:4-hydroxybenzoate polyprenyltransferase